jgi:peptide/nickel transport system permease protein
MTATLSALGTDSGPDPAGASPQQTGQSGVTWRGALAGWVGIAILTVTAVVTIFAPLIAPYGSNDQNLLGILKAPSAVHPFGTDELGRDVLTRVIYGGREALLITVLATAAGVLLGVALGMWTALSRRWTDNVVGRLADVQLALPSILLALVVLSFSGSNPVSLVVVLALGVWVLVFRVVRAHARSVAAQPFVEAARLAGAGTWQVVRRHVLPATLPLVAVATALSFSTVLLAESSLSFLGLGVQPPTPDWGNMVAEGQTTLDGAWWVSIFPGLAIVFVIIGVQLTADYLAERFSISGRLGGAQ